MTTYKPLPSCVGIDSSTIHGVGFIEEEAVSHYVDFEIPDNSLSYICDSLSYEFEF